jgi:hypothetical protein
MDLRFKFLLAAPLLVLSVSCRTRQEGLADIKQEEVANHWQLAGGKRVIFKAAAMGNCATDLPFLKDSALAEDMCFNREPIGSVSAQDAQQAIVCVATHEAGGSDRASLLLVNEQDEIAGESLGFGQQEVLGFVASPGAFRVYLGFPNAAATKSVVVRAALTPQFKVGSPACQFID